MYYYLTKEIKRRLINEFKEIFKNYPGLDKVKVSDKFPSDERPQYGVVVKNVSATSFPLAADNFMGTVKSYTFLASLKGKKSLLLDWVREDPRTVTKLIADDISSQVDGSNQVFNLSEQPVSAYGDVSPARFPNQVIVYVGGKKVGVLDVDGTKLVLESAPASGTKVVAEYNVRNLVTAGLYYFELTDPKTVTVDPLIQFNQTIIESAIGTETTTTLPFPVFANTLDVIEGPNPEKGYLLEPGRHYTISGQTLTWLPNPNDPMSGQTLRPNSKYTAQYRYQGDSLGEFPVLPLHTTEILPGVTTAFSNWLEVGDKQVVVVTDKREDAAHEFGGNFQANVTLDVYSRDPIKRELLSDLLAVKMWGEFKPVFDASGIMIMNVNINGEQEDYYDENTDTMYYMTGIDVQIMSDWRMYAPLLPKLKYLELDIEIVRTLNDFRVEIKPGQETIR